MFATIGLLALSCVVSVSFDGALCHGAQIYNGSSIEKTKSGVSVLFIDPARSDGVLMMLCISAGSCDEVGRDGVANLLSKIFLKKLNQNSETANSICECSSYVGFDQSVFYLYGKPDDLEKIIKNFGIVYSNLEFDQNDISECKQKVGQTFTAESQIDRSVVSRESAKCMYWHSKRGAIITGNTEDIAAISESELQQFVNKFYKNNRATLVVVGNVDKKVTLELVDKYFIKKDIGEDKVERLQEPTHHGSTTKIVKYSDQISVPMIEMYWEIPNYRNDRDKALAVEIFINALDNILQKSLIDEQKIVASMEFAYSLWDYSSGVFRVTLTAKDGSAVDKLMTSVLAEMQLIVHEGIMQEQANTAIEQMRKVASFVGKDVTDVASSISKKISSGNDFEFIKKYADFVKKGCELQKINLHAREVFGNGPMVISVIYPKGVNAKPNIGTAYKAGQIDSSKDIAQEQKSPS